MRLIKQLMNKKIVMLLIIIPFFLPLSFKYLNGLSTLYNFLKYLKVIIFIFIIIFWLLNSKRLKIKWFTLLVFLFEFSLVITSLLNDVPIEQSLSSFISIFSITCIVNYYLENNEVEKFFSVIFWYYLLMCVINLASIMIYKGKGIPTSLYTNSANPLYFLTIDNGTAFVNIFMIFLVVMKYHFSNNKKDLIYLIIPLLTGLLVDSASGKFITIALLALLLLNKLLKSNAFVVVTIILITLILIPIFTNTFSSNVIIGFIANLLGRDPTFTGRTLLWEQSIYMFVQRPLIGYGDTVIDHIQIWGGYFSSHNFYLEILLDGGLFSFSLFILLIGFIYKKLYKNIYTKLGSIFTIFTFIILLSYLVESQGHIIQLFVIFTAISNITLLNNFKRDSVEYRLKA